MIPVELREDLPLPIGVQQARALLAALAPHLHAPEGRAALLRLAQRAGGDLAAIMSDALGGAAGDGDKRALVAALVDAASSLDDPPLRAQLAAILYHNPSLAPHLLSQRKLCSALYFALCDAQPDEPLPRDALFMAMLSPVTASVLVDLTNLYALRPNDAKRQHAAAELFALLDQHPTNVHLLYTLGQLGERGVLKQHAALLRHALDTPDLDLALKLFQTAAHTDLPGGPDHLALGRRLVAARDLPIDSRIIPLLPSLSGYEDLLPALLDDALAEGEPLGTYDWSRLLIDHAAHPAITADIIHALMPDNHDTVLSLRVNALVAAVQDDARAPKLTPRVIPKLLDGLKPDAPLAALHGALRLAMITDPPRAQSIMSHIAARADELHESYLDALLTDCAASGDRHIMPGLRQLEASSPRKRRKKIAAAIDAILRCHPAHGDAAGSLDLATHLATDGALSAAGEAGALTLASPQPHQPPRPSLLSRLLAWLTRR